MATVDLPSPELLAPGDHPCWVVEDDEAYIRLAGTVLEEGRRLHQRTALFGPAGSRPLAALAGSVELTADPGAEFLGGGPLVPEAVFAAFRAETARARNDGYAGLRVVADMDWLLPLGPTAEEIVTFEAQLDEVVRRLEATVACAYRPGSFPSPATITAASCVHPAHWGPGAEPPFRVALADDGWAISGEIDNAVRDAFADAFDAVTGGDGPCVVDLKGLEFIDVAGMRVIATAAARRTSPVVLRGGPPILPRAWGLVGFDEMAPAVEFAG